MRSGAPAVVAAADADLGLGQVLGPIDADRRVGAIFAGSWHGVAPEGRVLPGDTLDDGKMLIVPARFPCYRLNLIKKNAGLGDFFLYILNRSSQDRGLMKAIRGEPFMSVRGSEGIWANSRFSISTSADAGISRLRRSRSNGFEHRF